MNNPDRNKKIIALILWTVCAAAINVLAIGLLSDIIIWPMLVITIERLVAVCIGIQTILTLALLWLKAL